MNRPPPCPRLRRTTRATAFTMIEVLVSMAIFAMAFVILADTYVNALQAYNGRPRKTLVDQDLAFVRQRVFRAPNRDVLEAGGTIETWQAGPATWDVEYEETEVIDLFEVMIEIELFDTGEVHRETLYLLRPSWSDPADRETLLNEKREAIRKSRFGLDWAPQ